jgi:alkyl sulfatase BDS1-like metallo-beta-lactamase superfamily hydrolase
MATLRIDQHRVDAVGLDLPLPPVDALGTGAIEVAGDPAILGELLGYLEMPTPAFNIVTP